MGEKEGAGESKEGSNLKNITSNEGKIHLNSRNSEKNTVSCLQLPDRGLMDTLLVLIEHSKSTKQSSYLCCSQMCFAFRYIRDIL